MSLRWSLDSLYTSFESEKFVNDIKKCDALLDELCNWSTKNLLSFEKSDDNSKTIETYIKLYSDFYKVFTVLYDFAQLSLSVNAKDEAAVKWTEILEDKYTRLTEPSVRFQKWLSNIDDIDALISKSEILKEFDFFLHEIIEQSKHLLSEKEEMVISKMRNTGSSSWGKLQELLSSTLLVDITIDGEAKSLPLPVVRNMAYEGDAALRRNAYEAELKSYKKIEDSSAACLNAIKGEVITLSKLRNYESPLDNTLNGSRMKRETLEAMLTAMKEYMPQFSKYYRKKGEMLGHKNGLPFYDMFAPIGSFGKKYTFEEAHDYIVKNFAKFSEKLSVFADKAFKNNWIDAEPREGKRGGAFCENICAINESRILSNFTGSFSDVLTLSHELGHAYHGECLSSQKILNTDYPMPIAETASIFCETIVTEATLKSVSKEEALTILEGSISDAGQVIIDIYSRYLFETKLFAKREEASLSAKELCAIMLEAQKEAYGDGLDPEYLHPYMWVCKPHYYYADTNFYNFPYAFGQLFAKGLYAQYLKTGDEFLAKYDNILSIAGKNTMEEVASVAGIDITTPDFWRESLSVISKNIDAFLAYSK